MKKKLLLGAVVLSMAMAFTACGSASSTGSEETTVAAEEETVAEDATEEETQVKTNLLLKEETADAEDATTADAEATLLLNNQYFSIYRKSKEGLHQQPLFLCNFYNN